MKITFYGFKDEEPISLTLPMDGFTQALDDTNQQLKSFYLQAYIINLKF